MSWRRLYHVFTYIYSLLIEKDICDRRNVLVKLPCVCVCLLSRDLLIFSLRVSSFFSYFFCVIHISVLFFPHGLYRKELIITYCRVIVRNFK
jgi:hypothetical protein